MVEIPRQARDTEFYKQIEDFLDKKVGMLNFPTKLKFGETWRGKIREGNTRRIYGRKGRKGDQDIRGSGYQGSSVSVSV